MNSDSKKHKVGTRTKKKGALNTFRWLVSVTLIVAIFTNSHPAAAFSMDNHAEITRHAFHFMADDVLDEIVDGNLDEDRGDAQDLSERHAVNCEFRASANYRNKRYREVIEALRNPPANDPDKAARYFGHLLHGIQDFYSHSNWIPSGTQGLGIRGRLFDSGLGLWPVPKPYQVLFDDVMIVEGDLPDPTRMTIRLPADENGFVAGAVPIICDGRIEFEPGPPTRFLNFVMAGGHQYRGLMTAGAPRPKKGIPHNCPPVDASCDIATPENVCLRHGPSRGIDSGTFPAHLIPNYWGSGYLNLDGDGTGDWEDAQTYAKLQTQHEWCRLLHLSRTLDPTFVASGRLLGTWVETDIKTITPHITNSRCARRGTKTHLVEISATPGSDAPRNLPFVVFRPDFTDSARTTAPPRVMKTLRICANSGEKVVASLMPPVIQGSTLIVQVPLFARTWRVTDHDGDFAVQLTIKVTPNGC